MLDELVKSEGILEKISKTDLERVTEILIQYRNSQLDFVDATIVAIAERMNVTTILKLDRRDFGMIRPQRCAYFEILP